VNRTASMDEVDPLKEYLNYHVQQKNRLSKVPIEVDRKGILRAIDNIGS